MKKIIFLITVTIFLQGWNVPARSANLENSAAATLTLEDCYRSALKQSETVAINAERIKEAEARFTQALGTLLPQVSFSATQTWQDLPKAKLDNDSFERKFIFKQTLFSGFKEFSGMSGSRLESSQYEKQKIRAEQMLFTDVADAFYLLLETKEDLTTLNTIKGTIVERVDELEKREKLGRSRRSEVVSTQTQLYNLEAQIEAAKSREKVARQLLEFLIGKEIEDISDSDVSLPEIKEEDYYLSRVNSRPDVQAAELAWQVSGKKLSIARSGLYPDVSLETDYYNKRTTAPVDEDWYTLLKINVPIFQGTTTYGAIDEAKSKSREMKLEFARSKRVALQEIRGAYANFQAAAAGTDALKKALKSAELNYTLQKQDYQLNLVNNLEVLNALQSLENTRRNFNHAFYEAKRLYWQLNVASGDISGAASYETKN